MLDRALVVAVIGIIPSCFAADPPSPIVYLCRSPLIAFNFWGALDQASGSLKIKLTREVVAQIAAGEKCLGVTSENLRPIQAGWGGSLALADGNMSPYYFHEPDSFGWVHPEYYVQYVNDPRVRRARDAAYGRNLEQPVHKANEGDSSTEPNTRENPRNVYHVGGDVLAPRVIYKTEPHYTDDARDRHIEGTVVLHAEVSTSGIPDNIQVVESLDPGLDRKAIEAVRTWRFDPGMKNGKLVAVQAKIQVNFRLQ